MEDVFKGKWVVLAGVFEHFDRHTLRKLLIEKGARVCSTVDRRIDFFIAGDCAGRRLEQATYFKIRVLGESHMLAMLKDSGYVEESATLDESAGKAL